jgi:hypothetical protein
MAPILDALLPFGALKRAAIEKLEADDSDVNLCGTSQESARSHYP